MRWCVAGLNEAPAAAGGDGDGVEEAGAPGEADAGDVVAVAGVPGVPRGDWAFRVAVNTALAEVYRSSEILDIFTHWFGGAGLRPNLLIGAVYVLGALPE